MSTYIGLDIGSAYTKVVEIEHKVKSQVINNFMFSTPFLSGQNEIDPKLFWQEITKQIPLARFKSAVVGVGMLSSTVAAVDLLLPRMSRNELAFAAIAEAKRKMIPVSGPAHIFEWSFLGEKITAKIPRAEVLVIRTEKITVQKILNLLKHINISPSLISPTGCVAPYVIPNDVWKKDEGVAVIDFGAASLNISICREGKLVLLRNVFFGIQDIVHDMAPQLGFSKEETEKVIRQHGVPSTPYDPKNKVAIAEEIMRQKYEETHKNQDANELAVNSLELRMLWQVHIDRIVQELRRSFVYYKEQAGEGRVEHIYFIGGGSQIENLVQTLKSSIGGHCNVLVNELALLPIFMNSVALALAKIERAQKDTTINFLPLELKVKEKATFRRWAVFIVEITLIAVCALAYVNALINKNSIQMSKAEIERGLKRIKNVDDKLKELTQKEEGLKQESALIEGIIKTRQDFGLPLAELGGIIPKEILLTRLLISEAGGSSDKGSMVSASPMGAEDSPSESGATKGIPSTSTSGSAETVFKINLEGQIFADYEDATKTIEDFQRRLESTQHFSQIKIAPLKLEKISVRPLTTESEELRLTAPKVRKFTLNAKINKK